MMKKVYLTNADIIRLSEQLYERIKPISSHLKVYGVPRGGIPVAYSLAYHSITLSVVDDPSMADVIVDDIICSGNTKGKYKHCSKPFDALIPDPEPGIWYVFPWEQGQSDESATDITVRFLEYIGENPQREGLIETPERMIRAWDEMYSGYNEDPKVILSKSFESHDYDQMIVLKNHSFYSTCEHHLLPFYGTASVAYIPSSENKLVVGISKLARLINCFARRLQIQERLTNQIAMSIMEIIEPLGVGVYIEAQHLCMKVRGVKSEDSVMCTSALKGRFLQTEVRQEFMNIIKKG
jgi:GTP cyclohydrolase I